MIEYGQGNVYIVQLITSDALFDGSIKIDYTDCSVYYYLEQSEKLTRYSDSFLHRKKDTPVLLVSNKSFSLDFAVNGYSMDKQSVYGRAKVGVKVGDNDYSRICASKLISDYRYISPVDPDSPLKSVRFQDLENIIASNVSPIFADVFARYLFEDITSHSETDKKKEILNVINSELKNRLSFLTESGLIVTYENIEIQDGANISKVLIEGYKRDIGQLEEALGTASVSEKAEIESKIKLLEQKIKEEESLGILLREAQQMATCENKTPLEIKRDLDKTTAVAEAIIKNRHALEYLELSNKLELEKIQNERELEKRRLDAEKAKIEADLALSEETKKKKLAELEKQEQALDAHLESQREQDRIDLEKKRAELEFQTESSRKQIEKLDRELQAQKDLNSENLKYVQSKNQMELEHLHMLYKIEQESRVVSAPVTQVLSLLIGSDSGSATPAGTCPKCGYDFRNASEGTPGPDKNSRVCTCGNILGPHSTICLNCGRRL